MKYSSIRKLKLIIIHELHEYIFYRIQFPFKLLLCLGLPTRKYPGASQGGRQTDTHRRMHILWTKSSHSFRQNVRPVSSNSLVYISRTVSKLQEALRPNELIILNHREGEDHPT
jgi:hypothetical protein